MKQSDILNFSVQINDGLTQTSADGVNMAFDSKYGIMFCVYMPGLQGCYGESRGRISLGYFPASQPTNLKTVDVIIEKDVYVPNIISLGDGKVRIFYEKNSRAEGDHFIGYKDFDFISQILSEEKIVMLKREDGEIVPLTATEQFAYLHAHGYQGQEFLCTEQISFASHLIFKEKDGFAYGTISSYFAQPILYRSSDNVATVEFFAVCPYFAQYEMDFKFLDGKIYGVFRTPPEIDSIYFVTSEDNGKTWSEPYLIKDSVSCRPRICIHNGKALVLANHYIADTGNRPEIQQGRTCVRLYLLKDGELPNEQTMVRQIYSKCGMVNVGIVDVLGDIYMLYSTSELALEYHNGNPKVRGKDALRYVKLGDLTEL